jgi:hypothetical protein
MRYDLEISLEGLRKTRKIFSQDRRYQGRDLNPRPPVYEVGVLTTRSGRSFTPCIQRLLNVCRKCVKTFDEELCNVAKKIKTERSNATNEVSASSSVIVKSPSAFSF